MATEKFYPSSEFVRNLPYYLRHDDFIDGQNERVEKYIVRHQSERNNKPVTTPDGRTVHVGDLMFGIRLERLENNNFCNPILTYHLGYLSREVSYSRALGDPSWDLIRNDLDGKGTKLKLFVRSIAWNLISYGMVGCLIEGPSAEAPSAIEAQERGERSSVMIYEPWNILKIERFSEQGKHRFQIRELWLLESVEGRGEEQFSTLRRFWINEQGEKYNSQRYKAKGSALKVDGSSTSAGSASVYRDGIEVEPIGQPAVGSFPYIPFVVCGSGPIDSAIYTVVPKNRSYLNKKSAFDSTNYYQCFQRIAAFGVLPEELSAFSENLIAAISNPEGKMQVIDAGNPVALKEDLDNLERSAYLDGLQRVALAQQLATKQQQSAEGKQEDKVTFYECVGNVLDHLEEHATEVMRWFWRFEKSQEPRTEDVEIRINRDFMQEPTDGELAEINLLVSWLDRFAGDAGREAIGLILKTKFQDLKLSVGEESDETELKNDLGNRILEAVKKNPSLRQLRTELQTAKSQKPTDSQSSPAELPQ